MAGKFETLAGNGRDVGNAIAGMQVWKQSLEEKVVDGGMEMWKSGSFIEFHSKE